jgi:hypothetical protein
MGLPRSNQSSSQTNLKDQKGFATVLLLTFLPVLLAGLFFLLFSQYYLKNWMQSLYICRTELLSAQEMTAKYLKRLMDLNPMAKSLRLALQMAQIQLAAAIAIENY